MQRNKVLGGRKESIENNGNMQRIQSIDSSYISQIIDEEPHTFTTISNSNFDNIDINQVHQKLTDSNSIHQDEFINQSDQEKQHIIEINPEFYNKLNQLITNADCSGPYSIFEGFLGLLLEAEFEKTINTQTKRQEREFLLGYLLAHQKQFQTLQRKEETYIEKEIPTPIYATQSYKVLFQEINKLLEAKQQQGFKEELVKYLYVLYLAENNWSIKYDILDFINWCLKCGTKNIQQQLSISLSNSLIDNISKHQFKFYQTITNEEQLRIMLAFSSKIRHTNINIASDSITFTPDILNALFSDMNSRTTYFYMACKNSIVCNFLAYSEVLNEQDVDQIIQDENNIVIQNDQEDDKNQTQNESLINQSMNSTFAATLTGQNDIDEEFISKKEKIPEIAAVPRHQKQQKYKNLYAKVDFNENDLNILIDHEEKLAKTGKILKFDMIMQQSSYFISSFQWQLIHLRSLIAYDCKPFTLQYANKLESLSLIRSECQNLKECINVKNLLLHSVHFAVSDLSHLTQLERFYVKHIHPIFSQQDKGFLQQLRNSLKLQTIICDCIEGIKHFLLDIPLPCLQLIYIRFPINSKRNMLQINLSNSDYPNLEVLDVQNGSLQVNGHDVALKRKAKESYLEKLLKKYQQCTLLDSDEQQQNIIYSKSSVGSEQARETVVSPNIARNQMKQSSYQSIESKTQRTFIITADNVEDLPSQLQFKHRASRATSVQQ